MTSREKSSLPDQVQVWIDGERKAQENAHVSVLDRGFLYGDSVFETLRTYGKKPFALQEHLERLATSARLVHIDLPISLEELAVEVSRAASESTFDECYVRVMVTRGQGALGLDPRLSVKPLRVLLVAPLHAPPASDYDEGIKAVTFATSRATDDTPAAGAKVGNYLVAVLASRAAALAGAKEALIENSHGQIVEGATSNVFWFEGDTLLTPPVSAGILAGITRRHVAKVAGTLGFQVVEKIPTKVDLASSDGVFISSSIREMLPVVCVDESIIGDGSVPENFHRLHAAFRLAVGAEPLARTSGGSLA